MEVEMAPQKRKEEKVIFPPMEEWPPAIRPAIQGKIKVLEDLPLKGHKIKIADKRGKTTPSQRGETMDSAEVLMKRLAPLLMNWLQENLSSLGFSKATASSSKREERPSKRSDKDEKKTGKPAPPVGKAQGVTGANEGGKHATTVPNMESWSTVVGRKSGGRKSSSAASSSAAPPPLQILSLSNRRRTRGQPHKPYSSNS